MYSFLQIIANAKGSNLPLSKSSAEMFLLELLLDELLLELLLDELLEGIGFKKTLKSQLT